MMSKKKDYQIRKKWFYAVPAIYPFWPYESRLAIGIKLEDAEYRNSPIFRFKVKGTIYEISRDKANILGRKYVMAGGMLPNLLPKEEFTVTKVEPFIEPQYEIDEETHTIRIIIPKKVEKVNIQLSIL